MKKVVIAGACALALFCLAQCNNSKTDDGAKAPKGALKPVPFPKVNIPGFKFPEDSNTINTWLANMDTTSITKHGWGIWAGLTSKSGYQSSGEDMYVFETWDSPSDLQDSLKHMKAVNDDTTNHRKTLHRPNQFEHAANNALKIALSTGNTKAITVSKVKVPRCDSPQNAIGSYDSTLLVTVAYDIPAASHILGQTLYDSTTLKSMYDKKMTDIPEFPDSSIAIKPTYQVIPASRLVNGLFPFRVYCGPNNCDSGYSQNQWPGLVYVNTTLASDNATGIDMGKDGANPSNTYSLNSFIHYTLSKRDAEGINKANSGNPGALAVHAGDIAIMVGMHVTTKEIKRWTWQTYWWTPDANNPPSPSSAFIAGLRPKEITGAPAHYAMAIAYSFTWPNQPYSGGNDSGVSQIAFNPFLEAGFGWRGTNATFYKAGKVVGKTSTVYNRVGCQTGCMSCHALATFNPSLPLNHQNNNYIPDTYIDMVTDSNFRGAIKLDFLWSIQASLIKK